MARESVTIESEPGASFAAQGPGEGEDGEKTAEARTTSVPRYADTPQQANWESPGPPCWAPSGGGISPGAEGGLVEGLLSLPAPGF